MHIATQIRRLDSIEACISRFSDVQNTNPGYYNLLMSKLIPVLSDNSFKYEELTVHRAFLFDVQIARCRQLRLSNATQPHLVTAGHYIFPIIMGDDVLQQIDAMRPTFAHLMEFQGSISVTIKVQSTLLSMSVSHSSFHFRALRLLANNVMVKGQRYLRNFLQSPLSLNHVSSLLFVCDSADFIGGRHHSKHSLEDVLYLLLMAMKRLKSTLTSLLLRTSDIDGASYMAAPPTLSAAITRSSLTHLYLLHVIHDPSNQDGYCYYLWDALSILPILDNLQILSIRGWSISCEDITEQLLDHVSTVAIMSILYLTNCLTGQDRNQFFLYLQGRTAT